MTGLKNVKGNLYLYRLLVLVPDEGFHDLEIWTRGSFPLSCYWKPLFSSGYHHHHTTASRILQLMWEFLGAVVLTSKISKLCLSLRSSKHQDSQHLDRENICAESMFRAFEHPAYEWQGCRTKKNKTEQLGPTEMCPVSIKCSF